MAEQIKDKVKFTPGIIDNSRNSDSAIYFIFYDQSILLKNINEEPAIPSHSDLDDLGLTEKEKLYFGDMNGIPCFIIWLEKEHHLPENYAFYIRHTW
jgi:NADH pyrophosphatase NudC (nudix superfamily)